MKKTIRVEKRVPFGFRGDWGKVFKKHTNLEDIKFDERTLQIESNYYVSIEDATQFKQVGDISSANEQSLNGLEVRTYYATVETTDSYWDDVINEFRCVVDLEDIVQVFGRYWMVTDIKEVSRFTPKKVSFYYCELKSLKGV